jgi:superfamily II DNA or RNA helicase
MRLVKKTEIEKPSEVYNLHINNDHNYIVEGAVVANCHQIKAEVLKSMLSGPLAQIPIRWGLTGTIPKEDFDFFALRVCIGEVIGEVTASDLQEQGILANCQINILQLVDYVEYKEYQAELKYLVDTAERLEFLASKILAISNTGNTLVLVDRIGTGKTFQELIPGSVFVSGSTRTLDRQEQYDQIAVSDNLVTIATYGVAAVGINVPRLHNVVLLEPGKSFVRVIQSIGRGLRKAHDKDSVVIWDVTSTCKFSKRHLTKRKQYYRDAAYPFNVQKVEWQR